MRGVLLTMKLLEIQHNKLVKVQHNKLNLRACQGYNRTTKRNQNRLIQKDWQFLFLVPAEPGGERVLFC